MKKESKSTRAELDRLLDWHDQFKPGTPTEVKLSITPDTARKFARIRKDQDGEKRLYYRNRIIIALGLGRKGEIPQRQLDAWGE